MADLSKPKINYDLCSKCKYRSSVQENRMTEIGSCDYISITGHSRPHKDKETYNNCWAFDPGNKINIPRSV